MISEELKKVFNELYDILLYPDKIIISTLSEVLYYIKDNDNISYFTYNPITDTLYISKVKIKDPIKKEFRIDDGTIIELFHSFLREKNNLPSVKNNMTKKFKIYIVFHDKIFEENYHADKLFSSEYYTILKSGNKENRYINNENVLDSKTLPIYNDLPVWYSEFNAIYNIFKNPESYKDLDYIGFSQYDKPLLHNTTSEIQRIIAINDCQHISLESHSLYKDFNQWILMDENKPNILTGVGKNCYYGIIDDYNDFFGTNYFIHEYFGKMINLVSSFLIPVRNFENIMSFISYIIESKKLDIFDTEHKYKLQGGLLERYLGVSLLFEKLEFNNLTIPHLIQK